MLIEACAQQVQRLKARLALGRRGQDLRAAWNLKAAMAFLTVHGAFGAFVLNRGC